MRQTGKLTALLALGIGLSALQAVFAETTHFDNFKKRLPWIWERPERPPIPPVEAEVWPADPVDRFVLARLEAEKMAPAGDTDPRTWLRRIHFAITGLPPSPEQTREFLRDTSPHRGRSAVRRLLDSPHYGERWARHWMDLVRFAESRGHESDFIIANAWRYRDYLVRAMNADLPYDEFVREHIAGDLLAQPRLHPESGANESVLATGWPFFGEEVHSPVDIRQDECDRTDNKIDVLGKTFLGLTISCARCHDHKFDAIRQSDYYALSGFIAGSAYRQVRFESIEHNRAIARELEELRGKYRAVALKELARRGRAVVDAFGADQSVAGEKTDVTLAEYDAEKHRMIADYSLPGLSPLRADGPIFGASDGAGRGSISLGLQPDARALEVTPYHAARRDPYWNGLEVIDSQNDSGSLDGSSRAGKALRTPAVNLRSGKLHYLIRGKTKVYAAVAQHIMVTGPLHQTLVREFGVGGQQPAWVSHDLGAYAGMRAHIEFSAVGKEPLEILAVLEAGEPPGLVLGSKTVTRKDLELALECMAEGKQPPAGLADAADWIGRKVEFKAGEIADGAYLRELQAVRDRTRWKSRTAVAWWDGNGVDESILDRGSPKTPLGEAARGLPEALGYPKISTPDSSGRLELAKQLTASDNPLLARVIVNRVWHHLFGRGLVGTVDNFGWLGERPTHPELLDYLAVEFMETHKWSLKSLIERLLLTRSFAMSSSAADPSYAQRDPDNVLLYRMRVRRLEAEAIRDSALAISGRLDRTVGGKPVAVHLTEFVVGRGRPDHSGPLDGAGRRSVYTAVRRNFLPTLMLAFDYPTPFSSVGRRDVTNVPAQSLALMNDPFLYEQAGVWADRLLKQMAGAPAQDRIQRIFEEAFAREAGDAEIVRCLDSLREFGALYGGDANARDAWRDLCHAMFSMNDFIYLK